MDYFESNPFECPQSNQVQGAKVQQSLNCRGLVLLRVIPRLQLKWAIWFDLKRVKSRID